MTSVDFSSNRKLRIPARNAVVDLFTKLNGEEVRPAPEKSGGEYEAKSPRDA